MITPTTPSDINLKKGLQIYFPFAGNTGDSSGNSDTITAVAGASLIYNEHGTPTQGSGNWGWCKNDPIPLNGKLVEIRLNNRVLIEDEVAELSKDFQQN